MLPKKKYIYMGVKERKKNMYLLSSIVDYNLDALTSFYTSYLNKCWIQFRHLNLTYYLNNTFEA